MSDAVLTSEVVALIGEKTPAMIFIATSITRRAGADTLSLQALADTVSQSQDCGRKVGHGKRRYA